MAMEKIKEMFEAHPYLFTVMVTSAVSSIFGCIGRKPNINITNELDVDKLAELLRKEG